MTRPGPAPSRPVVIALAGGVASGKSTVAAEFKALGAEVVDADRVGHEVLEDPKVRREILRTFGPEVVDDGGRIDRKRLGARAFADPQALEALNGITHPEIRRRIEEKLASLLARTDLPAVVLDVSLLLESGAYEGRYDLLVFVEASPEARKRRAASRGWNEQEIDRRQARQMPLAEKRGRADEIVDNSGSRADLRRRVRALWRGRIEH